MKPLILFLSFFCFLHDSASATPQNQLILYSIQVDASQSPNLEDYEGVKKYGFLHITPTDTGLEQVLLGSYRTEEDANEVLNKVKAKGYESAFLQSTKFPQTNRVYCVQLGVYQYSSGLRWTKYEHLGDLNIDASQGRVKLFTGTFQDRKSAQSHRNYVAKEGFTSAFVTDVTQEVLLSPTAYNFRPSPNDFALKAKKTLEDPYQSTKYTQLSDTEKKQVVFVDGTLSIKTTNGIIPLAQYSPNAVELAPATPVESPSPVIEIVEPPEFQLLPPKNTEGTNKEEDTNIFGAETPKEESTELVSEVKTRSMKPPTPAAKAPSAYAEIFSDIESDFRIQLAHVQQFDPLNFIPIQPLGKFAVEPTGDGEGKRVMLGSYNSLTEAKAILHKVKAKGFKNASIYIYENGFRAGKIN